MGQNQKEVNIVKSAYGKGEQAPAVQWFADQAKENARYVNGQKFERWQEDSGVQFSSGYANARGNTLHTEADLVKLREANPTQYQPDQVREQDTKGPRGSVDFSDPDRAVVTLFKTADISTIPHESAHIFLDNLMRVVADDGLQATDLYNSRIAEGMDPVKAQKILNRHMEGVERARDDLRTLREFAESRRNDLPDRKDGKRWEAVPLAACTVGYPVRWGTLL
jgi:hypothetical protein